MTKEVVQLEEQKKKTIDAELIAEEAFNLCIKLHFVQCMACRVVSISNYIIVYYHILIGSVYASF